MASVSMDRPGRRISADDAWDWDVEDTPFVDFAVAELNSQATKSLKARLSPRKSNIKQDEESLSCHKGLCRLSIRTNSQIVLV